MYMSQIDNDRDKYAPARMRSCVFLETGRHVLRSDSGVHRKRIPTATGEHCQCDWQRHSSSPARLHPKKLFEDADLHGDHDVGHGFAVIKAIGGYRQVSQTADENTDGSRYHLIDGHSPEDLSQYSVEIQATGKAIDDQWIRRTELCHKLP